MWLVLEEKRVPYVVEKVNMNCYGSKPAWFWAMQPSGGIPVAKLDGQVSRAPRLRTGVNEALRNSVDGRERRGREEWWRARVALAEMVISAH